MFGKSSTCFGKSSKTPLNEYSSKAEAKEAADYRNENYNNNSAMTPYKCEVCNMWHIAPKKRQTPSKKCSFCTGSDGTFKDLYFTREDAIRRAEIIKSEQGVSLQVYECQYNKKGWHLTRSQ